VENLGVKDKESLAVNGLSPYQELFCWILRPYFSQNREANVSHPTGDL
jgi:hypothetical protein